MGEKAMDKDKIDDRNYEELSVAIELAQHTVYKRFLEELSDYPFLQVNSSNFKNRRQSLASSAFFSLSKSTKG